MPPTAGSIIPKSPTPSAPVRRASGTNLAMLFGIFAVLVVGVGYGGLYAYTQILNQSLASAQQTLQESEKQFEPKLIAELSTLDRQLAIARTLLDNHTQVSPLLTTLQDLTSSSIQYDDFSYQYDRDGTTRPEIVVRGQARSYQAIAQQSTTLSKDDRVAEHIFSDFKVNANGRVEFVLTIVPSTDTVLYTQWLRTMSQDRALLPQDVAAPMVEMSNSSYTTPASNVVPPAQIVTP